MLKISPPQLNIIKQHVASTYPNEGGGLLIGRADANGSKQVIEVRSIPNQRALEDQHNRILITDQMYREGEAYADSLGLDLIGFFHSHPDHPARPSEFDQEHALPWWSYVIISVQQGQPTDVFSWQLRDDRSAFDAEELLVEEVVVEP
jgi:proteasome lid subunit RPN8/RPN11